MGQVIGSFKDMQKLVFLWKIRNIFFFGLKKNFVWEFLRLSASGRCNIDYKPHKTVTKTRKETEEKY